MYYSHFGLKQPPFKITPNTEFFFSGGNRGAVLDALVYAITSGEGIIKVVGEVGSGKTMLCRMLESLLPETVERAYLANPSVAPEDILHAIAFELQLELPPEADRLQVMQALQNHLIERHAQGHQVVIFVEEAQGMPLATLEEIRLLSNLETKNDKLLQIVLFGQPELDENLNQQHIRQLKERITHSFNLGPLADHDIGDYLIYRLRTAGYYGPPLFTKGAIKKIAKASKGLVRRINILADKTLLAAFAENAYAITPKHVKIAVKDSEFGNEEALLANSKIGYGLAAGMLIVGLALGFGIHAMTQKQQPEAQKAATAVAPIATTIPPVPAAAEPTPQTSVVTAIPEQSTPQPEAVTSDILEQRFQATKEWLNTQNPRTVTIQIMGTDTPEQMRQQLQNLKSQVGLENVYIYQTAVKGKPFTSVVYGSYPDRADALKAMTELPRNLLSNRPTLRTVGGIVEETKQLQ
jgi:type II secretory pathway predicted ATPase ExeA